MNDVNEPSAWMHRLEELGVAVRHRLIAARDGGEDMATAVAQEGGDTIFAIDRHVEPVIEEHIAAWPAACRPLVLVAEGMGESGRREFDAKPQANQGAGYRLIVDPIDGTRNIMYDKRSAWFIAAVAEDRGEATSVADALASVIVELPTSKAGWADAFVAVRGQQARGYREETRGGAKPLPRLDPPILKSEIRNPKSEIPIGPSTAATLLNGFAQVSNFFPGTKVLASELMERIVHATLGDVAPGSAAVFDDQYITTAGQMVELMIGHDRFCCDLRPLFYRILEKQTGKAIRGLECHPYDLAGMLVAQRAGVILTDGLGGDLRPPMDVHTGVHWCGYANAALRHAIEPVIRQFFAERGIH
ncbi:MAG: hypothetical protein WD042_14710 [Phycisphaeraceae bacterium]